MQFPCIHINGTDGKTLREEYFAAYEAVNAAIKALSEVTVHGRDYYVLATATGPDPSCVAMHEHRARRAALETVRHDLAQIITSIDQQCR